MKKIVYILSFIALILTGCDPLQDIYSELDPLLEEEVAGSEDPITMTLTAEDYETIADLAEIGSIGDNMYFTLDVSAKDYVPLLLDEMYSHLGAGSYAYVTYNYYANPDYLGYLTSATAYELSTADYDSMGTGSGEPGQYNNFSSSTPPEDYLPDFFATKYPDAETGDLVYVTYKYYSGSVSNVSEYYQFDGTEWAPFEVEVPSGVVTYTLTTDDYDSMGEESGQPGRYNNFSSSEPPGDYLPTFLKLKFPYAASGDKVAVIYKYYSGGTQTRADEYTFDGTGWVLDIAVTDLFVLTGDGWIFDPSIVLTMTADDYQMIVDYVQATYGNDYIDSYGTAEFYYGAGAYYKNFDIRSGKYDASFDTWQEAVATGIAVGLLPAKYPNATTQNNDGIDMMYKVTFQTYSGTYATPTFVFQCTKSGPSPEFTFVEEL